MISNRLFKSIYYDPSDHPGLSIQVFWVFYNKQNIIIYTLIEGSFFKIYVFFKFSQNPDSWLLIE